ncbi:Uncharacterized protein LSUB1_G008412 [Lachnellula subtilissima]|uniref:Calcineurin-like phosphoesterase domain-containing protein n=1 Tax=Lachnellula subtilissima TaxID=602034 RepID=A0A8H8RBQ1_9HELO|nr:Uncharacterized protein LSUB1_G008412 [Lachnellula subtilissima]
MPEIHSFHRFPALPTELRQKIWEIVLSEPIVAAISLQTDDTEPSIFSTDHSSTAQACKEAWGVRKRSHKRVELAINTSASSSLKVPPWIDFSSTAFYIGHGPFTRSAIQTLTPEHISTYVQEIILGWTVFSGLLETCKRLVVFQDLRRVVVLVAPWRDLNIPQRFVASALDLQDMKSQISGGNPFKDNPWQDREYLRLLLAQFLMHKVLTRGQRLPVVDIVRQAAACSTKSTMTSIQILSDLHLEAPKGYDVFEIAPKAPYLALIGDIGCVKDAEYFSFIAKQLSNFKIVFLLLGNHEPYHSDWATVKKSIQTFSQEMSEKKQHPDKNLGSFIFLDQTRYDLSPSLTILGCTLFSHIPPSQTAHVSFGLNDFYQIDAWTVDQHNAAHASDLAWLNAQVRSIGSAEPKRKILILTHHSPTTSARAVDPAHAQSKISSGFASELAGEECWGSANVKAWAFGHTHF